MKRDILESALVIPSEKMTVDDILRFHKETQILRTKKLSSKKIQRACMQSEHAVFCLMLNPFITNEQKKKIVLLFLDVFCEDENADSIKMRCLMQHVDKLQNTELSELLRSPSLWKVPRLQNALV